MKSNEQIVIGTKSGEILLYDLSSSSLLETFAAHSGPIWSLHVRPDGRGLVTGSADKDVKFWDFEVREIAAEKNEEGEDEGEDKEVKERIDDFRESTRS